MHRTLIYSLTLLLISVAAVAQPASPESQMTQTMFAEIRQLRSDLQTTAATIQRVQIVMYRLQSEATVLDRATQRLDQARAACHQAQTQQKVLASQIDQAETRKRTSQNPVEQKAAEEMLSDLKSSVEMLATEEQQRQIERADAENQFRAEQVKMSDLQDQLDKLDRVLAGHASK
jgi:chromosome segregation ATPase